MTVTIPPGLAAACRATPDRAAWLAQLPHTIRELERRWSLAPDAPFDTEASCAWVAPVTLRDGRRAVLKLGMPHMESEHEVHGLRFWNGDPTVRLFESDDQLGAMLMERCEPGIPLRSLSERDQDVIIGERLRRLWRFPPPQAPFRPLSAMTAHWRTETQAHAGMWPDSGLVEEGLRLLDELPRTASARVLLATDLHAGNVLRAQRAPWLVIDPKPFVGDPAYDTTQHLLNCDARMASDPFGTLRSVAEHAEVDSERVRLWTFARAAAEPRDDWGDRRLLDLARALAP
jgi:streptomycin 6-kinase